MSTSSPGPRRRTSDRPTARPDAELDSISVRLEDLERSVLRSEQSHARDIAAVRPEHRQDALNLVHYLGALGAEVVLTEGAKGMAGAISFASVTSAP